jgi:beta-lactamase regulating signal transducer with metallopeptidase domain
MNAEILINSKLIENLGWTLFHSLWQIALVALALFALLKILRGFSANTRYLVSVCALTFAAVLPLITFVQLTGNSQKDFLREKFSQTQNLQQPDKDAQTAEIFPLPAETGGQIENLGSRTVFKIENLQDFFDKNLSKTFPFVVGVWLFGVMVFALRLIGGAWQLHVYKTRGISAPREEWQKRFTAVYEKLKITQTVGFFRSSLVETPVVIGWLKPVILIPASVFLQINPKELETIIAHELVHIRRCDALVNLAQSIVEILFFYHPCVWWISSVVRKEREFAADEAVVKILENSHIVYASALANLEEIRLRADQKLPSIITAANGGNLMQRIQKILQKNTEKRQSASAWSAGLALALISAVLLTLFSPAPTAFVNARERVKDKKIAVGFVSIPANDSPFNKSRPTFNTGNKLIEKLTEHKIPAIGFVLGGALMKFETAGESMQGTMYMKQVDFIRRWRDAGLEVGIGNYRHVWFYHTPYKEYVAGVANTEAITRKILEEKNLPLKYFSYPFLNTGKNAEERNRFEQWLGERGITAVKYTIDNQEWMYSFAYDAAQNSGDAVKMNEIRVEFIKYMSKMFDHYEAYSNELFGRDIAQTLVLTPSRLVADSADDLFGMIERRGYKFVSMDEALKDEAYNTPENFYGKSGISWFERWQMARGGALRDEPEVNLLVAEMWKNKGQKALIDAPPAPPKPPAPPAPPKPPVPPPVPEP